MTLYLAHTAHKQFLGLVVGCVAWILTMAATGLNEWRLWDVRGAPLVSSGVAWVGIWRACFYSHSAAHFESCRRMDAAAGFVPPEITAARVLMVLAMACGLVGNAAAVYAVRTAYFSVRRRRHLRLAFAAAGALYVLTGACSSAAMAWNVAAVLGNRTIDFPPEFHMPPAPARQRVGSAVVVGMTGAALIVLCGLTFLCYRTPAGWDEAVAHAAELSLARTRTRTRLAGAQTHTPQQRPDVKLAAGKTGVGGGRDNPTFDPEEVKQA